jgi:protein PET100
MYYFGTNLDSRFSVPDFWPKPGESHTIPHEREEIAAELQRLKERRLAARARRLELEKQGINTEVMTNRDEEARNPRSEILEATKIDEPEKSQTARQNGWMGWFR